LTELLVLIAKNEV